MKKINIFEIWYELKKKAEAVPFKARAKAIPRSILIIQNHSSSSNSLVKLSHFLLIKKSCFPLHKLKPPTVIRVHVSQILERRVKILRTTNYRLNDKKSMHFWL